MKKILAMILALALVLSLAACAKDTTTNNTPDANTPSTENNTNTDADKPADTENNTDVEQPADTETNTDVEQPAEGETNTEPASAQEVMEAIFANWEFEYKDSLIGGGYAASASGAPDAVAADDTDTLQYLMYIPEANLADVTDASFVMNGMNANSFTAYTVKVSDAAAFGATMQDALQNNQWICGFPEFLMVYTIGDYCLIAFGAFDVIPSFRTALNNSFADAVLVYDDVMG